MRVVCIDDSDQYNEDGSKSYSIKKGKLYTVIESEYRGLIEYKTMYCPPGNYYTLAECHPSEIFHESCFIPIEEDQIDETTFERNYIKEKV